MHMLLRYLEDFQRLKPNVSNGISKPYKPALLLAVLEGVEDGSIQNNRIYITPELIVAFRKYRELLGAVGKYDSRHFAYPFYHLKSEEFWRLKLKPERQFRLTAANSIASLKQLQEDVNFAQLDINLWDLVMNAAARNRLREALLGQYQQATEGLQ